MTASKTYPAALLLIFALANVCAMDTTTTEAPSGQLESGYLWIPIVAGFAMFYMAWGIGANDVANAFATSFGARSITMKQAVFIATFCEFFGALALGSQVSATIRKGITDPAYFPGTDGRLTIMIGMLSSLTASAIWLHLASKLALPVSTTHTIVGGVIGFVVVSRGYSAVYWKKILQIVMSWLISPLLSCAFAGITWFLVKSYIYAPGLSDEQRASRAQVAVPPLTCLTWAVVIVFMIYKGAKGLGINDTPLNKAIGIGFGFGAVFGILAYCALQSKMPGWRREAAIDAADGAGEDTGTQMQGIEGNYNPDDADSSAAGAADGSRSGTMRDTTLFHVLHHHDLDAADGYGRGLGRGATAPAGYNMPPIGKPGGQLGDAPLNTPLVGGGDRGTGDDDEVSVTDAVAQGSQQESKLVELMFRPLNVLTASFESFAHGANDVANSIGPFNAIIAAYNDPLSDAKVGMPKWILCLGGVGIVLGLWTYGERVMRTMGKDITYVTPSRAFCIELAATFTILFATNLGLPVSTTHASVGAVVGIGVVDGASQVNWGVLRGVFTSWITTLPAAAMTTAALFGFLVPIVTQVYNPNCDPGL